MSAQTRSGTDCIRAIGGIADVGEESFCYANGSPGVEAEEEGSGSCGEGTQGRGKGSEG
jgi:hypothetical protein